MARLDVNELLKITKQTDELFLYALLAEENVELQGSPYDDGLMELYIVMDPGIDTLPKRFLNDKLSELGWDMYDGD